MRKIPTLFERVFENGRKVGILNNITPGFEWVLDGDGVATEKIDGSCCAVIGGKFYRRYDAKIGRTPPPGAIPCCAPDEVTGHWPHWVRVDRNNKSDKWHVAAWDNTPKVHHVNWTYEAVGPHFHGNMYRLEKDILVPHGWNVLKDVPRSFDGIREYLRECDMEGIVFWRDNEPQCKIKKSDFGFEWKGRDGIGR